MQWFTTQQLAGVTQCLQIFQSRGMPDKKYMGSKIMFISGIKEEMKYDPASLAIFISFFYLPVLGIIIYLTDNAGHIEKTYR